LPIFRERRGVSPPVLHTAGDLTVRRSPRQADVEPLRKTSLQIGSS
jgi:hypothetical protein